MTRGAEENHMVSRRDFLKLTGAAAGTSLVGPDLARAATMHGTGAEFLSVLVDTPLCIGCQNRREGHGAR